MPRKKIIRLVLGDQLNENHAWFKKVDRDVTYVLMEIRQETDYVKHHIQKVAAFFAAMRAFAQRLSRLGHRVVYVKLDDRENRQTIDKNVVDLIKKKNLSGSNIFCPTSTVWMSSCRNWPKHFRCLPRRSTRNIS